jgi:ankyrin repeat protein
MEKDLYIASYDGDLEKAKRAIEKGADVNVHDYEYGRTTPLHKASWEGHASIVSLLLEKGADVNAKDKDHRTPLHKASTYGHEAIVSLLLEKGADPNVKAAIGLTPLFVASRYGHESIVSLGGETPLHCASMKGHEAVVALLLEHGADMNAEISNDGWTPLHLACEYGHEAVVSLLLEKGADMNAKSYGGWTPLHLACKCGHEAVVSVLLERGADSNVKKSDAWSPLSDDGWTPLSDNGSTPLHMASRNGHESIVSLLLERGADVNVKKSDGWTPLSYACRMGHEAIISLLLERGADVNAKDKGGKTPLHKASWKGHESVISLLLEKGADVNVKDKDGKTPLHCACGYNGRESIVSWGGETPLHNASWKGHESVISLLLERGADVNVKDNDGKTPLHCACGYNGRESIVSWGGETPLHNASWKGHESVISLLLEKGADVNVKDNDGKTPLHCACGYNGCESPILLVGETPLHKASWKGHESVISLLLENGADVNINDKDGKTPLHYACGYNGCESIVSLLLEKGADIEAKDKSGWTPLHEASMKGHESIVSLLLREGAEFNAKINDGATLLYAGKVHWASECGKESLVSLLLEKGADIEAKGKSGWTPLHRASVEGADPTITDSNGNNPLRYAQEEKNRDCVAAVEKFRLQKEYSEEYKTHDAFYRELQRLKHLMDAAKDSLDPNVNSVAVTAKAEYEMILPLCKWLQYMSESELELEIASLEDKGRGLESREERIKVLKKIVQMRKTLEPRVQDGTDTQLKLAQEQFFDEIRGNSPRKNMQVIFNSWPVYETVSELKEKIARLEKLAWGMDIGEERMQVFLERNKLKQHLREQEIQVGTKIPPQLAQENLPDSIQRIFTCPISGDIMEDPVMIIPSGKTFNRESICSWLLRGTVPPLCPWTKLEVHRQIPYMENRDTRDFLIHYLGEEAYKQYDDSEFESQYYALWNEPIYREISALLYGMNHKQIDWIKAQEVAMNASQDDPIIIGFKALLLHPEVFPDSRLHKDKGGYQREWEQAKTLGLTVAADAGNKWAQWIKGIHLDIVEQNLDSAMSLYKLASELELPLAQCSRGILCEDAEGYEWAEYWYEQASVQGHALAQYNLAMLHEEADFDKMRQLLEQAAAQDHALSLYYLGTLYIGSTVVKQDFSRAVTYFERSTEQGNHEALQDLVNLFLERGLLPQDKDVKRQVFEKAAEQGGNILATYKLLASLLCAMNQPQVDWADAQQFVTDRVESNPYLVGFILLCFTLIYFQISD